jgi:hypothetical protein
MPEFDLAKETRYIEILEPEMTKELFTLFVLLAVPLAGLAGVCPTTTDNQVIAGGDCSITDKTFGSWSFPSSASGGATQVQASAVAFDPLPTPNNPGVSFSFGFGAGIGQVQDETFGFTVTVPHGAAPIADIHLLMLGAAFTGTGSASIAEIVCLGDLFANGCAAGKVVSLSTFDNSTLVMLSDSIKFAPVTVVDVIKDLELTGGTKGTAVVSAVEYQFSEDAVPESGTLALVGIGVICLGGFLRQRLSSNS